ncbi:hypothetical protein THAOC_01198, partial [Thalassiosira oceanica]
MGRRNRLSDTEQPDQPLRPSTTDATALPTDSDTSWIVPLGPTLQGLISALTTGTNLRRQLGTAQGAGSTVSPGAISLNEWFGSQPLGIAVCTGERSPNK